MQLPCEVTQGNHDTWMKSSRINKLLADLADKYSYMNELGSQAEECQAKLRPSSQTKESKESWAVKQLF